MRRFFTMATAAVLVSLAAGGCASRGTDEELTFPEPALTLTIQEAGKTFPIKVGQYAKISLKENPTTGYSWFFRTDTGKRGPQPKTGLPIELAGERLLPAGSGLVGAPQTREVMVKAVRPGTIYLVGNCIRPWEKGAKPEISVRYEFRVTR
ncbi:protease inhibitor I42 family protein [uncultured Victivallis sp.]|uniref:protease inhibitor I42 family protein n=1 Tax=uncultured Victivallis sp. TaxID=354118 RepID=UPI0025DE5305|nr:protease inhibitor I42 family protein [uncultured Victivallis sp.]